MCHNEHIMYHKAIWPTCHHSHYRAQPNTHTHQTLQSTKHHTTGGFMNSGGLKNIVREVAEWTAWGIYGMWWFIVRDKVVYEKKTTACCLGGKIMHFLTLYLDMQNHPPPEVLPSTPDSVFCISHGKETWDFLICIFILSSGDLVVFVDGDKQAAQHLLNWDFQTKEKRQFTIQSSKLPGAKAS